MAVANKPDGRGCGFFDSYRLKPALSSHATWSAVHDAVHGWFPKLLNSELHDETTNGQMGGAIVHDPLEKSGVVFETKFPMPDDLDALTEDSKPCVVVLDDWMNRNLEDPGYVDVFTKLAYHHRLMLFVTQQVLFPPQRQVVALLSNASGFFLFKFSTELASVRQFLSRFMQGAELSQA